MKTVLSIILTLVFLTGFKNLQTIENEYLSFKNQYKSKSYSQLDSKILTEDLFENSDKMTLIDTPFLLPLKLVDTSKNGKEWGIKNLVDYDCRLINFTENKKFDCITTISYTSTAGDGNPIILVNTYDKKGKFLSSAKFDIIGQHDYSPVPTQYLSIIDCEKITMDLQLKNFEIVDSLGTEVLKYIGTDYLEEDYTISKNGIIIRSN
ncbi:hypothetical protein [Maribellus sediminis]|uniref:hypothetical protein n=1 Tax=Maribellus sediminis TaxID=2696285 RepID=UPI001431486F|nr:hypothetical protein [Maribellus sediminis]